MITRPIVSCAAPLLLAVLVLALPGLLAKAPSGQDKTKASGGAPQATAASSTVPAEFKKAGVCARCHVLSVLEWGISAHLAAETTCQDCHGASRGHVANERNEVKPDRLPRGEAIAKQLCSSCHETGCPETQQVQSCQECHHAHALIHPKNPPTATDDRFTKLVARWAKFQQQMSAGEHHVKQKQWQAARTCFQAALEQIPGNHRARTRLEMCLRRLRPQQPGVEIVDVKMDPHTGLPAKVRVIDLRTTMLLVPPGQFDMGSDSLPDSRPVHSVRIKPFYLGEYEITQAEWTAIMETNPSAHQGEGFAAERYPVERVSWSDCQEFLRRLNARIPGGGFRLPTEAEWEYACRAADPRTARPLGDNETPLGQVAWFRHNTLRQPRGERAFVQVDAYATKPGGTRRPNSWGFYDMQGNVCEWCSSLFHPYLYDSTDGREALASTSMRVLRGGSFADTADALDVALRHPERPERRLRFNGLRLARSILDL